MAVMNPRKRVRLTKRRKKRCRFLWDKHSNHYSYPSYEEWYSFNWGKLAVLISGACLVLIILFIIFNIFI